VRVRERRDLRVPACVRASGSLLRRRGASHSSPRLSALKCESAHALTRGVGRMRDSRCVHERTRVCVSKRRATTGEGEGGGGRGTGCIQAGRRIECSPSPKTLHRIASQPLWAIMRQQAGRLRTRGGCITRVRPASTD
jgi:hypothetical protein